MDFVDHDLVKPEIRDEGVVAVRRKSSPVGVRRILSFVHYLRSASVLNDGGFTQFSIAIKWKESNRSTSVLGGEQEIPAWMNRNVSTSAVGADHPAEFLKRSVLLNVVTQSAASILPSSDRIQDFAIGM